MRHLYLTLQAHLVIRELLEGDYDAVRPSFQGLLHDQALDWLIEEGAATFNSWEANARREPAGRLPFVPHLGALRLNAKAQVEHRAVRHDYGMSVWPHDEDAVPSSPTGMRLVPRTEELASNHVLMDTYDSQRDVQWSRRIIAEGLTDHFVSQDQSTWHTALSVEPRRRIEVQPLTQEARNASSGVHISPRAYIHIYPHGGLTVTLGLSLVCRPERAVGDLVSLIRLLVSRSNTPAFQFAMPGLEPASVPGLIQQLMSRTVGAITPSASPPSVLYPDYAVSVGADREELSDAELSGLLTRDDRYEILRDEWVDTRASLYGKYAGDRVLGTRTGLAVATSPKNFPPSGRRRFFWRCHAIKEFAVLQASILYEVQDRIARAGTSSGPDEATVARLMAIGEHLIDFPRGLPAHHRKWFYECQRMVDGPSAVDGFHKALERFHHDAERAAMMRRMEESAGIRINLSHSQIGTLNLGTIVGDVETHLAALTGPEVDEARDALQLLAQALVDDQDLSEEARRELLESVDLLAEEAGKQPERRRSAVVRSIMTGLGASLAGAGGLAEVWSTVGPTLVRFFGG
jgi:hypothetical protein